MAMLGKAALQEAKAINDMRKPICTQEFKHIIVVVYLCFISKLFLCTLVRTSYVVPSEFCYQKPTQSKASKQFYKAATVYLYKINLERKEEVTAGHIK